MASKSLLCHLGKQRKSYKVNLLQNQVFSQSRSLDGQMAGRYHSSSNNGASESGDAPPPKKRKTEGEEDEDWGDDLEFTQADLEDLEIQASQAYAGSSVTHRPDTTLRAEPQPSVSRVQVRPESHTSGPFVAPTAARQSSLGSATTRQSSLGGVGSRVGNGSHPTNTSRQSSLLSRISSGSSSGSTSSYPPSLTSSEGGRSSASINSGSSGEMTLAQRRASLSRGASSDSNYSLDVGRMLSRDQTMNQSAQQDEAQRVKQECQTLKLQLEKMKEDVTMKEGEIKLLRENLKSRETDLSKLKQEKINTILEQNKQQTEKEKTLQVEVDRLQTKLQFSEEEKRELGNRCRDLEGQIRGASPSKPSSQVQTSPRPRRVPVEERLSPKASQSFPTKSTFHAQEGSPKKPTKGDHPVQDAGTMTRKRMNRRQYKLNVSSNVGVSGSQLVARLLDITPSSTGSLSERGIVGLLHTPSASSSAQSVSFDRDRETSLLSPCRRRISDVQTLLEAQEKPETSSIVSLDHFNMAVHGLTQLLREDSSNLSQTLSSMATTETMDTSVRPARVSDGNDLDHAVLILPLLNDYLKRYINMLESSAETLVTSPSITSSSSGSYESSADSSLGLILKDSATYANNLENLALASLRTLHVLTSCRSVRSILVPGQTVEEAAETSTGQKPETSSNSGCDRRKTGETAIPGRTQFHHLPLSYIEDLHVLQKLVKLADPGTKGHLFNVEIVGASLTVLKVLAQTSDEHHIQSLMPVVSEEVLHNCIECESEPSVICGCLELLRSLVRNNISGLCTKASECVMLCLYHFCTNESAFVKFPPNTRLQISQLIVQCLSSIIGHHKEGLTVLLESDCECSVQVVPSIVVLLCNVVKLYKEQKDNVSFAVLQNGVYLLHQMYQHELNFTRRHLSVQPQYVVLISHLSRIFKLAGAEKYDNEVSALQDLWDFSPDEEDYESSHDRSHDSDDDDDTMDTS